MDFLKLVTEARTCRRYDGSRELEPGTLSWLVDCARLSPSAGNLQVMRYITVQTPAKRDELYPALVWAAYLKDWKGPAENERPTGYVIFIAPKGEDGKITANTYIDIGIMGQTMQQAAWSRGIGACMFRGFNPKKIAEVFPIPEDHEIVLVITFGYPVEERRIAPIGADGSVRYFRDENNVHFVPKREMKDVLLGEY